MNLPLALFLLPSNQLKGNSNAGKFNRTHGQSIIYWRYRRHRCACNDGEDAARACCKILVGFRHRERRERRGRKVDHEKAGERAFWCRRKGKDRKSVAYGK